MGKIQNDELRTASSINHAAKPGQNRVTYVTLLAPLLSSSQAPTFTLQHKLIRKTLIIFSDLHSEEVVCGL